MYRVLPVIVLSCASLLGGYSAGVQPRTAADSAPPGLAQALADETHRRLADEFLQQDVGFELAGTRVWAGEGGAWRVRGEGTADFGPDGQAATTIEGLYDPHARRWVKLEYQLL
jgi:hypothetical protein